MPEIKSYAVELYDKPTVYIQYGERFDMIDGTVIILDRYTNLSHIFFKDRIKRIEEGVFDGQ